MKAVLDTNILVDYLAGSRPADEELRRYDRPAISTITWIEVMVGARPGEDDTLRGFLARFDQIPVDAAVAEAAVDIRRRHRIRLPDAIIWAAARTRDALLVTRNERDFPADDPGVRVPYRL